MCSGRSLELAVDGEVSDWRDGLTGPDCRFCCPCETVFDFTDIYIYILLNQTCPSPKSV